MVPNFGMVLQCFRNEAGNDHMLMSPQQFAKPRSSFMHCSAAVPLAILYSSSGLGLAGEEGPGKMFLKFIVFDIL